ncbi:MAG: N-acetylmuramoyl-L-alanine amidase [Melioribacter sp.]|nr:N-acetylmuramoyl-L-alanine amidase [Melioribacter sp.]
MKKYIGCLSLIMIIATACSTGVDVAKKEIATKPINSQYFKDKISVLDFGNENLIVSDLTKNKITNEILTLSKQNPDAVIFKSTTFSKLMLTSSNSEFISQDIIKYASELAHSNGLEFFIAIDFNYLDRLAASPALTASIKNNFNRLVKNYEFDGFYFYGIDFSSKDDNNLFEDIIVESVLVKPFLIVTTPNKFGVANRMLVDKYLETGIIDFLIDDEFDNSINYNKDINFDADAKILNKYLKRLSPEHFISFNLSEVTDKNITEVDILNENRTKNIDADMKLNFILSGNTDTVNLKIGNRNYKLSTSDWAIPYNYLLNKDNTVSRYGNWVEFRRPFAKNTRNDIYNLLCKTKYPSKVFINDDSVKIYKTGIFFKKIKLKEGLNKLRAEAIAGNSDTAVYEDRILFQQKDPSTIGLKLSINDNSIEPAESITLTPEDFFTVSFNGTKSQVGFVELTPGNISFECQRKDFSGSSNYEVQIPLKNFTKNQKYSIKLVLKSSENNTDQTTIEKVLGCNLFVKDETDFPLLTTTQDNSLLTFTLAPIRLGAPIRNELPKNVVLKSNGIFGDNYRVHLSDTEEGYINREFVQELPNSSVMPGYFINPISCYSSASADIIKIPYLENVPYEIYPDPEQKRIIINLYGVRTSSTWMIHRNNLRFIENVTWQQTTKETYKIYINLKTSKIWGYDIKPYGKELIFRIKYPPTYNVENNLPLKGIKISLEAGHGGSNIGAVGLSGLKEKEINLKLCKMLESLFKEQGAEILQVRDSDKDMTLTAKRDTVTNSDANIHLSIHANSSEPSNEFLGASGTCTFYHNPFWAKLAEKVFNKLIELDVKPFGVVGSFNYRVTRMSDMPSILVEQAFLSNAEDEEKLNDDNFRQHMAEKIYEGLIDYLKYMKD